MGFFFPKYMPMGNTILEREQTFLMEPKIGHSSPGILLKRGSPSVLMCNITVLIVCETPDINLIRVDFRPMWESYPGSTSTVFIFLGVLHSVLPSKGREEKHM
uniref:Uncharacterized protein n=1 Tax=Cacopsylla melanoneura TaxID=428564 RepID=A0A8D8SLY6_9HEMI